MASDRLEALLNSIIPLSELRKSRRDDLLDASTAIHPPLAPVDKVATTRRMQQDYAIKTVEKLTERIEELIGSVKNLNAEQKLGNGKMNSLVDQGVEQAATIVNRVQERILTAVGQPAQADILQEILESQRLILGIIQTIQQQTTTMQTAQANLQATLITLIAQTQQVSSQIISSETNVSQKLEAIKETISFSAQRSRPEEENVRIKKKRRISGVQRKSHTRPGSRAPLGSIPILTDLEKPINSLQIANSPPLSSFASLTTQEESPLSPPPLVGLLDSRRNDDSERRPLPPNGRLKKAQRLASFFGHAESIEEAGTDDLFSKLERV
ncbi:hypothetical protein FRC17_009358 [Serendipita sp. 399]|nr:hypothetical protein FRC17_009358 [Serendipita sp. 399]